MIVLDANVLIGFLDSTDPHHNAAVGLLERRLVDGFGSSVLTVAEALVHPTKVERQDGALASLHRIGLQIIPLYPADVAALARVRNTYRLRMPDAVALHAALSTGSTLASFDSALLAAAQRAGIPVEK